MRGNDLTLCEWNYLLDNKQELTFTYTNWKNDTRQRKVGSPMSIEYMKGDPKFHPEQQYRFFLVAFDLEKEEYRDFELSRMEIDVSEQ